MARGFRSGGAAALALVLAAPLAGADEVIDDELVINGEIPIVTQAPAPEHVEAFSVIRSGWTFRSPETQAMEMDDFDNPAILGVEAARDDFDASLGANGESCASCHESPEDLAGVRAVYPKWDDAAGEVQTIEMQVNECVTERMGAEAWPYDASRMVNMSALMSFVSRGEIVNVAIDGPAAETWQQGKDMYYTRYGQLELSCANCHEDNYDNMIRADHLSQGMVNGFPTYRLKNTKLNSVHNRFKGCIRDTMAQTFSPGSPEFVALELYVASRGNGLSVEGPAVRN
ncbi:sulfur oxidation c-type cytochrome SoxA [Roseivivax isoporae]|uniref:SoxAX cytochrome complex subunit A n=1 Tax=Roseivivax isoporae LMG 25204 TaxID=1449351 RepID=X7F2V1_9RHOB|nr:sulfur oxidation c-type cytochrome SoxA [Roseivivax isoporae]ETX27252.1 cytochrome C [Roseivivax isoporae LMG 25204]